MSTRRGTSSLLIHESPLQVLPRLAAEIGLGDAIVMQQIHYLAGHPQSGGWVALTTREWIAEHVPFYSPSTLKRIFDRLRDSGLVVAEDLGRTGDDGGIRTRIRIDYDALEHVAERLDEQERARQTSGQNDPRPRVNLTPGLVSKRPQASGHSDTRPRVKMTPALVRATAEKGREGQPTLPSLSDQTPRQRDVDTVIAAWAEATDRRRPNPTAAQLTIVDRALDAYPVEDCIDAVKAWRRSSWHNGDKDGQHRTMLAALLHPDQLEQLRDLHRGVGKVAGHAAPPSTADIQAALSRRQGAA